MIDIAGKNVMPEKSLSQKNNRVPAQERFYQSRMNPIQLTTLGLYFAMKVSTARYLLVEIEDDVDSEITEHGGNLIYFQMN